MKTAWIFSNLCFVYVGAGEIAGMEWSCDSELLAVVLAPPRDGVLSTEAAAGRRLQIWHRRNWHWYCKLERRVLNTEGLHIQWDAEISSRLHLVTAEGNYFQVSGASFTNICRCAF